MLCVACLVISKILRRFLIGLRYLQGQSANGVISRPPFSLPCRRVERPIESSSSLVIYIQVTKEVPTSIQELSLEVVPQNCAFTLYVWCIDTRDSIVFVWTLDGNPSCLAVEKGSKS